MPRKATRNANGTGTIRKRPDGRWEARYIVGRDPGTGKQIRRSIYGQTQTEVRKKLQQAAVDINEGVYCEPSKLSLAGWLDVWLSEYNGHVKPSTLESYVSICNFRLKPAFGAIKINALNAHVIQTFYNRLSKGTKDEKGLSAKTIRNIHTALHKALQQAVALKYLKYNPADACTLPRYDKPEMQIIADDDLTRFFDAIDGHPFEMLFKLDIFSGLRRGELLGLSWDCFDPKECSLHIYRQLQRQKGAGFIFTPLKNDKPRDVAIPEAIAKQLQQYKRQQNEMRLRAGNAWINWGGANLIFTNELGNHLCDTTVSRHFKNIVKGMGLPGVRLHDLRHSYAVASLQAGIDAKTLQECLGHATAAFTMDVYCHATDRMKKDAADRLDALYKSCLGSK